MVEYIVYDAGDPWQLSDLGLSVVKCMIVGKSL